MPCKFAARPAWSTALKRLSLTSPPQIEASDGEKGKARQHATGLPSLGASERAKVPCGEEGLNPLRDAFVVRAIDFVIQKARR